MRGLASVSLDRLDLDPGRRSGPGHPDPDDPAMEAPDHDGLGPASHPAHLFDLGDGADSGVPTLDLGHQEDFALGGGLDRRGRVIGLDREGHDHAREHDTRREWQQWKGFGVKLGHDVLIPLRSRTPWNGVRPFRIPE